MRRGSVEHVLLVELDPVKSEHGQEFGLEVLLLVMLALSGDVRLERSFLRFADRKDAVALLPCELPQSRERVVDPLRRTCLHRPHQVRHRTVGPPAEIQMHMVFDAPDVVEHALLGPDDAADVRIEAFGDLGGNPGRAASQQPMISSEIP